MNEGNHETQGFVGSLSKEKKESLWKALLNLVGEDSLSELDSWTRVEALYFRSLLGPSIRAMVDSILSGDPAERPFAIDFPESVNELLLANQNGKLIEEWREFVGKQSEFPGSVRATLKIASLIVNAVISRDSDFFKRADLAWRRLVELDSLTSHAQRIAKIALELRDRLQREPTKGDVREAYESQGQQIAANDWPKYFKLCGLDFLQRAKPGPKKKSSSDRG